MRKNIIIIAAFIAATFSAKGQQEFYLTLDDPGNLTKKHSHGLVLRTEADGKERQHPFMFKPGQAKIYFVPLDSCMMTPQEWWLADTMIGDGDEIQVQVFRASDRTKCLPEIITQKDIADIWPFLLSDGDQVVIKLKKIGETTAK